MIATNNNQAHVKLGFIALIDCAPFVIAKEKGFFLEQGVDVTLSKEASWASIRDKVAFNLLDGAHMLASMPLASTLGVGTVRSAMQTSFTVSHNGNGITVGNDLYDRMQAEAASADELRNAKALKAVIEKDRERVLRFAIVYPYSSHNYQLRDWLARADIDPDKDVQIIVVPPTKMTEYLQQGEIDGYCVGEPWNSLAVEQDIGHMIVTGYEIWGSTPEKVLGVNAQWANQNPQIHHGIIRALDNACAWVQNTDNTDELLSILSAPDYLNCTEEQLRYGFSEIKPKGKFDWPMEAYQTFSGESINYPSPNYALWVVSQMLRWQQLARPMQLIETINQVYRQDIFCEALGRQLEPLSAFMNSTEFDERAWLQSAFEGRLKIHPNGIEKGVVY